MCPHCGQNAPLVYRGVSAFCSACNQPRMPFTANAVNLRGKPAKIGGTVAAVVGWLVLFGSLAIALVLGAILQAIFPPGAVVGWVVGGLIGVVGLGLSMLLLFGGQALKRSGTNAAYSARMEALGSLASLNRGVVTAASAAEALGVPPEEADAFLTAIAKQPESGVSLEVEDDGKLYYRFARYAPAPAWPPEGKVRVDAPPQGLPPKTQLGAPLAPGAEAAQVAPRVATEVLAGSPFVPAGPSTGPDGTKVVASRPSAQGVRVDAPEPVPADDAAEDEAASNLKRMRS